MYSNFVVFYKEWISWKWVRTWIPRWCGKGSPFLGGLARCATWCKRSFPLPTIAPHFVDANYESKLIRRPSHHRLIAFGCSWFCQAIIRNLAHILPFELQTNNIEFFVFLDWRQVHANLISIPLLYPFWIRDSFSWRSMKILIVSCCVWNLCGLDYCGPCSSCGGDGGGDGGRDGGCDCVSYQIMPIYFHHQNYPNLFCRNLVRYSIYYRRITPFMYLQIDGRLQSFDRGCLGCSLDGVYFIFDTVAKIVLFWCCLIDCRGWSQFEFDLSVFLWIYF